MVTHSNREHIGFDIPPVRSLETALAKNSPVEGFPM
jgi:hypothetical protein